MEEMRVQIEAREPTDGEIRAFWFTLPIDTEQVEELLGIDVDTDYYYITDKELPFADEVQEDTTVEKLNDLYSIYENLPSDLKEDYGSLMCYFSDLDELHRYRNDMIDLSPLLRQTQEKCRKSSVLSRPTRYIPSRQRHSLSRSVRLLQNLLNLYCRNTEQGSMV